MELLVAIALMIFLMTIVIQIFLTSTDVFNRAKAKTEIYQNARYAMDRIGKEINNSLSLELGNQDFRVGAPGGGAAPAPTPWAENSTTFPQADDDGQPVTAPYLVMITSTSWIDSLGQQVVGSAKVAYRIKRNPVPDTRATVTCTLQRVLYRPDAATGISPADRLQDSNGVNIPTVDYCQFLFYDAPNTRAHFGIQWFDTSPGVLRYVSNWGGAQVFNLMQAAPRNRLPPSLRVIMDVIDEKDREIRTMSRQYMVYAAKLN